MRKKKKKSLKAYGFSMNGGLDQLKKFVKLVKYNPNWW